jgi:hypothetical protein
MLAKSNYMAKASPKVTILPLPNLKNQNLKFGGFFRGAMVFGKYLQPQHQ